LNGKFFSSSWLFYTKELKIEIDLRQKTADRHLQQFRRHNYKENNIEKTDRMDVDWQVTVNSEKNNGSTDRLDGVKETTTRFAEISRPAKQIFQIRECRPLSENIVSRSAVFGLSIQLLKD